MINDNGDITYHKDTGLVYEVFHSFKMAKSRRSNMATGYIRYLATGYIHQENAQPLVTNFSGKTMTLARSGNSSNTFQFRADFEKFDTFFC